MKPGRQACENSLPFWRREEFQKASAERVGQTVLSDFSKKNGKFIIQVLRANLISHIIISKYI